MNTCIVIKAKNKHMGKSCRSLDRNKMNRTQQKLQYDQIRSNIAHTYDNLQERIDYFDLGAKISCLTKSTSQK